VGGGSWAGSGGVGGGVVGSAIGSGGCSSMFAATVSVYIDTFSVRLKQLVNEINSVAMIIIEVIFMLQ